MILELRHRKRTVEAPATAIPGIVKVCTSCTVDFQLF